MKRIELKLYAQSVLCPCGQTAIRWDSQTVVRTNVGAHNQFTDQPTERIINGFISQLYNCKIN